MPPSISVIEPVGKALDWMLRMLFRPFDLGKWFTVGFCAWLACLGEGGISANFPGGGGGGRHGGGSGGGLRNEAEQARDWVVSNLYWLVPVVIGVLLLIVVFGLLCTWLSSRGKFMFLHCVAGDRAEVAVPWRQYSGEADNLFWFRVVLWLVGFVTMLILLALILFTIFSMVLSERADPFRIFMAASGFIVFVVLVFAFVLIGKFITDFLVPIMFLRRTVWRVAGRELMGLIGGNIGSFVLYILFQILLGLVIGTLTVLLILVTCCIAGCIMAIPYLGTVLLLPILVFQRAYSVFFLAQFGPEYNVFAPAASAPVV